MPDSDPRHTYRDEHARRVDQDVYADKYALYREGHAHAVRRLADAVSDDRLRPRLPHGPATRADEYAGPAGLRLHD
ncbi:MAG: hypothetical protein IIB88_08545 [Chloroflexi bacterium]|nr:hypothetical protein [Chloroflexota bacterium]